MFIIQNIIIRQFSKKLNLSRSVSLVRVIPIHIFLFAPTHRSQFYEFHFACYFWRCLFSFLTYFCSLQDITALRFPSCFLSGLVVWCYFSCRWCCLPAVRPSLGLSTADAAIPWFALATTRLTDSIGDPMSRLFTFSTFIIIIFFRSFLAVKQIFIFVVLWILFFVFGQFSVLWKFNFLRSRLFFFSWGREYIFILRILCWDAVLLFLLLCKDLNF